MDVDDIMTLILNVKTDTCAVSHLDQYVFDPAGYQGNFHPSVSVVL